MIKINKDSATNQLVYQANDADRTHWLIVATSVLSCAEKVFIIELTNLSTKCLKFVITDNTTEDPLTATMDFPSGDWRFDFYKQPLATQDTNLDRNLATLEFSKTGEVLGTSCPSQSSPAVCPDVVITDGINEVEVGAGGTYTCEGGITPLGIAYDRPPLTMQDVSFNLYDDAWQIQNGIKDYTPPVNPIHIAALDRLSAFPFQMIVNNNTFGHKFRFTGTGGGYQDPADNLYYDKDGVLSDRATEFPDELKIDHYTGLMWFMTKTSSISWATSLQDAFDLVRGGFTDFFLPDTNTFNSIINRDVSSLNTVNQHLNYAPMNNVSTAFWTSSTSLNITTSALRSSTQTTTSSIPKTNNNIALFYRNHFN